MYFCENKVICVLSHCGVDTLMAHRRTSEGDSVFSFMVTSTLLLTTVTEKNMHFSELCDDGSLSVNCERRLVTYIDPLDPGSIFAKSNKKQGAG